MVTACSTSSRPRHSPMRSTEEPVESNRRFSHSRTDLHWHDLRHEGARRLLADGVDIRTIQLMVGHADMKHTQRYLNITDEELRKAMTGVWECRRQLRGGPVEIPVSEHERLPIVTHRHPRIESVARLTGLEPVTPGLEGPRKEATGSSTEPLLPFFLSNSTIWGNPRTLRAATHCQSFVSRLAS